MKWDFKLVMWFMLKKIIRCFGILNRGKRLKDKIKMMKIIIGYFQIYK